MSSDSSPTLTLRVAADDTGLKQLTSYLSTIRDAVKTGGELSTAIAATKNDVAAVATTMTEARVQAEGLAAAYKGLEQTHRNMAGTLTGSITKFHQLTGVYAEVTKAIREQKNEALLRNQALAAVPPTLVGQLTTKVANENQAGLLDAETARQIDLKTRMLALDNERLKQLQATTVRLAEQAKAQGVLTQAEYESYLSASKRGELESQRNLKQGGYAAEIRAEEERAAKISRIRDAFYAREESRAQTVASVRSGLKQGGYAAEIRAEEERAAKISRIRDAFYAREESRAVAAQLATPEGRNRAADAKSQAVSEELLNRELREQVSLKAKLIALSDPRLKAIIAENAALRQQATATHSASSANRDFQGLIRGTAGALGGLWLSYGAILPMMAAFSAAMTVKSSFTIGAQFEHELTKIKAISEESIPLMDSVRTQLQELSRDTYDGPVKAAEGLGILVQAGYDAQEAMEGLPSVIDLATIGMMDMGQAAETIQTTIHSFNLELSDAPSIVDKIAKASAISATSNAAMAKALERASTVASQFNMTLDDQVSALAVVAQRHLVGERAGTAFTNMMRNLATPTDDAKSALRELGINTYDSTGHLRNLKDIVMEFHVALKDLDPQKQAAYLNEIFNERGIRMFEPLLAGATSTLQEFDRATRSSVNFGAETAKRYKDDVYSDLKLAGSALAVSLEQAFDSSGEEIRGVTQELLRLANSPNLQSGLADIIRLIVSLGRDTSNLYEVVSKTGVLHLFGIALKGVSVSAELVANAIERINKAVPDLPAVMGAAISKSADALLDPDEIAALKGLVESKKSGYSSSYVSETYSIKHPDFVGNQSATPFTTIDENRIRREQAAFKAKGTAKDQFDLEKEKFSQHLSELKGYYTDKEALVSAQSSAELISGSARESTLLTITSERLSRELAQHQAHSEALSDIAARARLEGENELAKDIEKQIREVDSQYGTLYDAKATAIQTGGLQVRAAVEEQRQAELKQEAAFREVAQERESQSLSHRQDILQAQYDLRLMSQTDYQRKSDQLEQDQLSLQQRVLEAKLDLHKQGFDAAKRGNAEYMLEYDGTTRTLKAQIEAAKQAGLELKEYQRIRKEVFEQDFKDAVEDATLALGAQNAEMDAQIRALRMSSQAGEEYVRSVQDRNEYDAQSLDLQRQMPGELEKQTQLLSITSQAYADAAAKRRQLYEESRKLEVGAKRALEEYAESATNAGKNIGEVLSNTFSSAEDAMVSLATTGKASMKDMVNSIMSDLARMVIRQQILGPIARSLMSALPGAVGASAPSGGFGPVDEWGSIAAGIQHSGGMAGSGTPTVVPASMFNSAVRLHKGLDPDEYPAILQSGERVLNRRETAEYSPGGKGPSKIVVEIKNMGSKEQQVTQVSPRIDLDSMVIEVMMNDLNSGGPYSKALSGAI